MKVDKKFHLPELISWTYITRASFCFIPFCCFDFTDGRILIAGTLAFSRVALDPLLLSSTPVFPTISFLKIPPPHVPWDKVDRFLATKSEVIRLG